MLGHRLRRWPIIIKHRVKLSSLLDWYCTSLLLKYVATEAEGRPQTSLLLKDVATEAEGRPQTNEKN